MSSSETRRTFPLLAILAVGIATTSACGGRTRDGAGAGFDSGGAGGVAPSSGAGGEGACPPWEAVGIEDACSEQNLIPAHAAGAGGLADAPCIFAIEVEIPQPLFTYVVLDCAPLPPWREGNSWGYPDNDPYSGLLVLGEELCSQVATGEFARVDFVAACPPPEPP